MKILYLAYYFPPSPAVASRRFRQLVGGSFGKKHEQFAITRASAEKGINNLPVKLELVSTTDLRDLLTEKNERLGTTTIKKKGWRKKILPFRQAYPFLYLTDDGGPLYRRKAFKKACELIRKHGITTVFSSFRPWSDHLVAAKLKRKFPELKWIADFRDLPVDPVHQNVWWPALQRWWGKRQIKSADEVWTVSEGQRQQMAGWHPNIRVKRNALAKLPPSPTAPRSDKFTIVYTGSLYLELRTPRKLVFVLQKLLNSKKIEQDSVRLVYRGKDHAYFRQFTQELPSVMLDIQPSIAPAAAHKMQHNAQLLLLLTWSAPGYFGVLTAKVWDYLATGRPILALVNGPEDPELKGIIEGANAGVVFDEQEQGELEEWLLNVYQQWERERIIPWAVNTKKLEQYL